MSWASASPLDTWGADGKQTWRFLREVWARAKFNTFTWDPPNVPANSTVDTMLTSAAVPTLDGLRVGQAVTVSPPASFNAGLVIGGAWVVTDNSLTIRLGNITGVGINAASGTWTFQGVVP